MVVVAVNLSSLFNPKFCKQTTGFQALGDAMAGRAVSLSYGGLVRNPLRHGGSRVPIPVGEGLVVPTGTTVAG